MSLTFLMILYLMGACGMALLAMVLIYPWFGASRTQYYLSYFEQKGPFHFPEGFLWGTSTAAQQIEHQHPSDWTAFEKEAVAKGRTGQVQTGVAIPGHIHDLDKMPTEVREKKTDHDARIKEDVALMKQLNQNAYRFSISWSRLFPEESTTEANPEGIAFYKELLDTLEAEGIKPSATLFHFSSPAWLWEEKLGKRGWEREDALAHFERFVKAVVVHFGARIDHWCTLNEPMVYLYNGYLEGLFPPNEKREEGPIGLAELAVTLLRAHLLAYKLLKEDAATRDQKIEVGIAKHTRAFEAFRNHMFLDRITAQFAENAFIWDFLDALHTGEFKMTSTSFKRHIEGLKGSTDYVGINYYGRFYLKSNVSNPTQFEVLPNDPNDPRELTSELGWALYPHGFYKVLEKAHKKYGKPIYILENGIDCRELHDPLRQHFLVTHLHEVWNAITFAGADVRGFFYWSTMDNFEWAEGFGPRFGLIHIDYENDFKRTPRESAALFAAIAANNAISQEQWSRLRELEHQHTTQP